MNCTAGRRLGVSLWETIATITDRTSARPRESDTAGQRSLAGFRTDDRKTAAEGRGVGAKRPASFGGRYRGDRGHGLRAICCGPKNSDESEARLENLEELVNAAADYDQAEENGLRDFIDHAALTSDTDKYRPQRRRDNDDRSFGKRAWNFRSCFSSVWKMAFFRIREA